MKPTDELYQLIHSLSKGEKRYVKIFASKHLIGEANNYLLLFDAILAQEEYDEEALKRAFANTKFIRHLTSEKVYLYKFILRSMRSFNSEKSIENELKEGLADVQFLMDKRLLAQAMKNLSKIKKMALDYEKYPAMYEALLLERKALFEMEKKDLRKSLEDVNNRMTEVTGILNQINMIRSAVDILFSISRTKYSFRTEEEYLLLDTILDEAVTGHPKLLSFQATIHFHLAHVYYYRLLGQMDKVWDEYKLLIKKWNDKPLLIIGDTLLYRKILSNYLNICQTLDRLNDFEEILKKIETLPCRSLEEEASVFQNVYYLRLRYLMNSGKIFEAEVLVPEIEKGMQKYHANINKGRELSFYFNIAVLFLVSGKPKESLSFVKKILDEAQNDAREDIQQFARIFQLLLHYELKNYDLLDYLIRSTYRYLHRKNSVYQFESLVISSFKKLVDSENHEKEMLVFREFRNELYKLKCDQNVSKFLGVEEVFCWTESKLQNKSLEAIIKESITRVVK